ncbi:hypothetical protein ES703_23677 [subsurface metagenome]
MRNSLCILITLLLFFTGCQSSKTEPQVTTPVGEPERRPLESPFDEIIPSAEDLFITPYHSSEETIYYPDGSVGHLRMFANESASTLDNKETPAAIFSMLIYDYLSDEQAMKRIQKEKDRRSYDDSDTGFYAKLVNFAPENIAGYVIFWKEPAVTEVQGEEVIFFRVGNYVGNYKVWLEDPPELKDGYFMPPDLHDSLIYAVQLTISRLRSQQ